MTAKEYLNQARHLDALINCRLREIDYWRELSSSVSGSNFEPHYNPNKPRRLPLFDVLRKSTPFRGMWREKSHTLCGSREKSTQPSMHLKCGMSSWYFAIGTLTTVLGRRFPGC